MNTNVSTVRRAFYAVINNITKELEDLKEIVDDILEQIQKGDEEK